MRNVFLVCYDVCNDKRLKRVYKAMPDPLGGVSNPICELREEE